MEYTPHVYEDDDTLLSLTKNMHAPFLFAVTIKLLAARMRCVEFLEVVLCSCSTHEQCQVGPCA